MIVKHCKCGAKKKEVACAKEYTCDIKCKKMRDCGKHTCNRKCCNGSDCPTCDQQCNKTLSCKNHKCNSRCHRGSCYPCTLTQERTTEFSRLLTCIISLLLFKILCDFTTILIITRYITLYSNAWRFWDKVSSKLLIVSHC